METSASLLERLRQPNQDQAWSRFVKLYTPLLFYWARKMGCQDAEAADLVQEVLTLLLGKMASFDYDGQKSFRGWLRTVAHNCWHNQRRRVSLPRDASAPLLENIPAPEADPFWEEEYRQQLVGRALELMQAEFQPSTWKACWETIVEGKPPAQVATELGISTGAVYMAKSRVLSRLRQELAGLIELD